MNAIKMPINDCSDLVRSMKKMIKKLINRYFKIVKQGFAPRLHPKEQKNKYLQI